MDTEGQLYRKISFMKETFRETEAQVYNQLFSEGAVKQQYSQQKIEAHNLSRALKPMTHITLLQEFSMDFYRVVGSSSLSHRGLP